jgi:hypothetical protein
MLVEAFATGWSLLQKSANICRNKITKPPVWGGQGPYKDRRATEEEKDEGDDDDDDDDNIT